MRGVPSLAIGRKKARLTHCRSPVALVARTNEAPAAPGACSSDSAHLPIRRTEQGASRRRRVREPSAVGLPFTFDEMHGITDPCVGLDIGFPKIVERAENVVMVARRERQLQESRIEQPAGRAPPEKTTLEQIFFAAPSGRPNFRSGANRTLILEQPFKHADRGVERRTRTLRGFAVLIAVIELFVNQTAGKVRCGTPEVATKRERAPINAWLNLTLEEGSHPRLDQTQLPEAGLIVPS
jgi:hypothetical protein